MSISGHHFTANFGLGDLKVFLARPGETTPIKIDVKDGRDLYAVGLPHPFPGGTGDTNRQLSYEPDRSWRIFPTFYATHTTNFNRQWTFNLGVLSNTPPDFYLLTIQTAGITNISSGGTDPWNHLERIYVQVAPEIRPMPRIEVAQVGGATFSVKVPTTNGLAYSLEYKRSLEDRWITLVQVPGTGEIRILSDTNLIDSQRFYRVRVE